MIRKDQSEICQKDISGANVIKRLNARLTKKYLLIM